MHIQKYLQRIGVTSIDSPTLEQLTLLQQQHLLHIPFENLDIHLGKRIILDDEAIFEKVVIHRRGGFCYELNGLFYRLLKNLGYEVKRISARVNGSSGKIGKEYDHLAIIVTIENQDWLVDVGFGKFAFQPLEIVLEEEQEDGRARHKISKYDETYFAVYRKENSLDWALAYLFTKNHRAVHEFEGMCHYHQTSADTNFTKRRLCTIPTQYGRLTLTDTLLKMEENEVVTETEVDSEETFRQYLKRYFDLEFEY